MKPIAHCVRTHCSNEELGQKRLAEVGLSGRRVRHVRLQVLVRTRSALPYIYLHEKASGTNEATQMIDQIIASVVGLAVRHGS